MFIARSSVRDLAEGTGVKIGRSHIQALSTSCSSGAESVAPHGEYLLTNLHPNCFRSQRSAFSHFTDLQGGTPQIHHRDRHKEKPEAYFDKWDERSLTHSNRAETVDGAG